MNTVYLGLGGNLGDRAAHLEAAKNKLLNRLGRLINESPIYETAAWGKTELPNYLNSVVCIETPSNAQQVLETCMQVESELGRTRDVKWESRVIDIDVLLFNEEIIDTEQLKVPHPHIQDRLFVLVPLEAIAPDYIHPVYKLSIRELRANCTDNLKVIKWMEQNKTP